MDILLFLLVVTSIQPELILGEGHVAESDKMGEAELYHRLGKFEIREREGAEERQLLNERMALVLLKLDNVLVENKQLKQEVNMLNNRVNDIENDNKKLRNELNEINADNHIKVKENVLDQGNDMDSDTRHVSSDKTGGLYGAEMRYIRDDSDVNRIRRAENEVDVAFYAVLNHNLDHLGVNQNIAFNRIITNVGNAYNVHAGDFRAPVSGIYVFHVSLLSQYTHYTHYTISKNSVQVGRLVIRGSESPYTSMSQMAVLQLNAGDDVAVQNENADEALNGGDYSSFSGFLLKQDLSKILLLHKHESQ